MEEFSSKKFYFILIKLLYAYSDNEVFIFQLHFILDNKKKFFE